MVIICGSFIARGVVSVYSLVLFLFVLRLQSADRSVQSHSALATTRYMQSSDSSEPSIRMS